MGASPSFDDFRVAPLIAGDANNLTVIATVLRRRPSPIRTKPAAAAATLPTVSAPVAENESVRHAITFFKQTNSYSLYLPP